MKIRHFNIMRLLYCLVLALPFVAILSRVIYVQSNKNAYQSAQITQTTYSKIQNERQTNNEVLEENYYFLDNYKFNDLIDDIGSGFISFNLIEGQIYNFENSYPSNLFVSKEFYLNIDFDFDNNTANFNGQPYEYSDIDFDNTNTYIQGIVYMVSIQVNQTTLQYLPSYFEELTESQKYYYSYKEVQATTLDNVFEYSVNKFIDDNNFGRINLFQWTTNLFFDSNEVNNMYVHFVNWYLNYVLLMSTTYILFLVLMWFVNYSRRLLERGMNYDW